MAETLTQVSEDITLCHESFGDPGDPPLLLVMGLGTQMIAWHEDFCAELAGRGFHVIRFDNRDSGRSTHLGFRPPSLGRMATRRLPAHQYTLDDMAADTAALAETLELGPFHVVGVSMGGMIGQVLAARRPQQVRSLVSIMSNTGSRVSGQPTLKVFREFLRRAPDEREAFAKHVASLFALIGSPGFPADREDILDQARRSYDRGHDPAGTGRQLGAITKSGNRTPLLRAITAPTLVIHGKSDRLVRPSGGRAAAVAIPGARLELIEGMGHDLPRALWSRIIDAIARNAAPASRPRSTAAARSAA